LGDKKEEGKQLYAVFLLPFTRKLLYFAVIEKFTLKMVPFGLVSASMEALCLNAIL